MGKPLFIYLENLRIIENTNTSTRTFTIPPEYSGVFIQFYAANSESAFGYLDCHNIGCNLEIKKGTETGAFRLNVSTRIVTVGIYNKSDYQKKYGNYVHFWGMR